MHLNRQMMQPEASSYFTFAWQNATGNASLFTTSLWNCTPLEASPSHLIVPNETNPQKWHTVIEPWEMEAHLLAYCQTHFQTPQGSPYTVPPLINILGYDSLTPFGEQILQGTANLNNLPLQKHTKLTPTHLAFPRSPKIPGAPIWGNAQWTLSLVRANIHPLWTSSWNKQISCQGHKQAQAQAKGRHHSTT